MLNSSLGCGTLHVTTCLHVLFHFVVVVVVFVFFVGGGGGVVHNYYIIYTSSDSMWSFHVVYT